MTDLDASDFQDDETKDLHGDELLNNPAPDSETEVTCPYCGETVVIALDPASGAAQDYVEDCEVCCRPWQVKVQYDEMGKADVHLEQAQ